MMLECVSGDGEGDGWGDGDGGCAASASPDDTRENESLRAPSSTRRPDCSASNRFSTPAAK
eukprot:6186160-Pleurochrysis_carterae.AAC.1